MLLVTNKPSSPYNIFITKKGWLIETFEFDFCDLFQVFHVCGPFLRSCRPCRVQCGVVLAVHPLLPSPAPSSARPPHLSRLETIQRENFPIGPLKVQTVMIFLMITSMSATLCQDAHCRNR